MKTTPPLALSVEEAAKALGIGRTKLYAELAAGRLSARKSGKRTLILMESIQRWLGSLESYKPAREG